MDENVAKPQDEVLSQEQPQASAPFVEDAVAALKEQVAAEKDKYIRLLAEFDNMRKRSERERIEMIKYAHEEVIIELLKTFDDMERSLNAFKAKEGIDPNLVKGLQMVYDNLAQLMHKYEVKPIPAVGTIFDPNKHEPLMMLESAEHPDGHIVEEFQKGYTLAGKVVRTAKVKVAKNNNS